MSPPCGVVRLLTDEEGKKQIDEWCRGLGKDVEVPDVETITDLAKEWNKLRNRKDPGEPFLLLRPPSAVENSLLRSAGVSSTRLYCAVSTDGLPLSIRPTALHPWTPVEALVHYLKSRGFSITLDKNTLQRCVARRDGWHGLQKLGLSWAGAEKILKEIKARSLPYEASLADRLRLAELDLLLHEGDDTAAPVFIAPPEQGDKREPLSPDIKLRPLLVFYRRRRAHGGGSGGNGLDVFRAADISRIEFIGPVQWKRWCLELMGDEELVSGHRMKLEHGETLLRFQVAPVGKPCDRAAREAMIGRLLEALTGTGRPLRDWGLTLFLPFSLCSEEAVTGGEVEEVRVERDLVEAAKRMGAGGELKNESVSSFYEVDRAVAENQAMLYFSPAVRKQVFEDIRHYRLKEPGRYCLEVALEDSGISLEMCRRRLPISDLSLFCHPDGQALLAVRLQWEHANDEPSWRRKEGDTPWWSDLLDPAMWPDVRQDQMEVWLVITRALRWLYRSFPEEEQERREKGMKFLPVRLLAMEGEQKKILLEKGFTSERPLNAPLLYFLTQFFPSDEKGKESDGWPEEFWSEQESDRLYVSTTYALAGPAPTTAMESEGVRRLFSLALYVDSGKDGFTSQQGFAYDRAFTEERLTEHGYHRWEGVGTFIGHTDNATAYLGFGDHFVRPIARIHVPYIYNRFLVLALLQHRILRQLQRRAQELPVEIGKEKDRWEKLRNLKEELQRLRRKFIDFTNRHWVHYPTEQVQGKEMYRILSRTFALEETYAMAREKLEKAEAFAAAAVQEQTGRLGRAIGYVGLFLTLAAFLYTDAAKALVFDPLSSALSVPEETRPVWNIVIRLGTASLLTLAGLRLLAQKIGIRREVFPLLYGGMILSGILLLAFHILVTCISATFIGPIFAFLLLGLLLFVALRLWEKG